LGRGHQARGHVISSALVQCYNKKCCCFKACERIKNLITIIRSMTMDIPSLLSVLDDTEPADQSTRVNQIPLIGKSYHLNTSSRALAAPIILTGDASISGAWMNSRLQERISFWSSIHGKRNPVCDSIAYGPLGAYQARNLL
jgi:hypothetical protein